LINDGNFSSQFSSWVPWISRKIPQKYSSKITQLPRRSKSGSPFPMFIINRERSLLSRFSPEFERLRLRNLFRKFAKSKPGKDFYIPIDPRTPNQPKKSPIEPIHQNSSKNPTKKTPAKKWEKNQ
jgi:hypothetical protein